MIKTEFGHTECSGTTVILRADYCTLTHALINIFMKYEGQTREEAFLEIESLVNDVREYKASDDPRDEALEQMIRDLAEMLGKDSKVC